MSIVFISYRHEDAEADAGRLYDTLATELGKEALYKDVENIAVGRNWRRAVKEALVDSAAVISVMGPAWRPSDAIEFELNIALTSNIPVIPFLVRNADLGQLTRDLKAPLSEIRDRNAMKVSHGSWLRDCRGLVETLRRVLADPSRARVLIQPPDPRTLLDEANWPGRDNPDRLLGFAQDLAECLHDPILRKDADASYAKYNSSWRPNSIRPDLLDIVRMGLQRLKFEQYVQDLLDEIRHLKDPPPQRGWEETAASKAATIGELLGDPSIGERAAQEVEDIKNEISEISRTKGDSGSPDFIRSCQAGLYEILRSAGARLLEEVPGIDQPGFTNKYPKRDWPAAALGKTKEYGDDL
jgi:hypothetical protein